MSKFLQSRPNLNAVLDGSLALYGASIGATNLTPGFPVRVDTSRRLQATTLAIGDITGLQDDLTDLQNKTQNIDLGTVAPNNTPFIGAVTASTKIEGAIMTMVQTASTPPAQSGRGLLWSDTSNQLHYATVGGGDQVIASGGPYLPLAGGTMTGSIDMGSQEITNTISLRFSTGNGEVTIGDSVTNSAIASTVVGSSSITSSADTQIFGFSSTIDGLSAGSSCIGRGSSVASSSSAIVMGRASSITNSSYGIVIGSTSGMTNATEAIVIGITSSSSATHANCIGKSISNSTANSLLIDSSSNFRSNSTTCDLGTTSRPFQTLYLNTNIAGPTYSRSADNIVSNSGASTSGNLASFSSATGKVITDSTIVAANVVTNSAGSTTAGQVATYSGTTGKIITNSTTPILGTPASGTLTNCTGLPISTGVSGLATNVAAMLGSFTSLNISAACLDETGTGSLVFAASPTLISPILGTPTSGLLTNCTGLPISTGVSGLGTSVATMLGTFSSANIRTACTDETGTGALVFATNPDFTGPTARSQPLTLSKLTQYGAFSTANTNVPTSYINGNSVGSQIYGANTTNTGMVVKVRAWAQLNNFSGGGTLNISLYLNGSSFVALLVPSTTVGYLQAEFDCTIMGTTTCRTQGILHQSGQAAVIGDSAALSWDKTVANTVDVRFTFSTASINNAISPLSVNIETHYQT